jgi:uncharacterized membrane protein YraQ (UPF0718 family)
MLMTSGTWLMISFIVCGLLHGILRPEAFQKSLGNKKNSSIVKATISGMLLPICSCGVLPLAVGLYYSGAYLGPVLAFLVATPVINPAAVILSYALLGPQISTVYLISGFVLPFIIGVTANKFGGNLTESPYAPLREISLVNENRPPLARRLINGLKWGFADLAVQTCRFIIVGTACAAFILAVIPAMFIQTYLANPELISLIGITILGAIMYVCAVGHIPFIAALVSAGAAPGVAIAFLLAGVSTNLPEMISIWKLIGKRAVFIYTGIVVIFGILAGYMVNLLFAGSFVPQFDLSQSAKSVEIAGYFDWQFSEAVKTACAIAIAVIGFYAWAMYFTRLLRRRFE